MWMLPNHTIVWLIRLPFAPVLRQREAIWLIVHTRTLWVVRVVSGWLRQIRCVKPGGPSQARTHDQPLTSGFPPLHVCTNPITWSKALTLPSHGCGSLSPCFLHWHFLDYYEVDQFSSLHQQCPLLKCPALSSVLEVGESAVETGLCPPGAHILLGDGFYPSLFICYYQIPGSVSI